MDLGESVDFLSIDGDLHNVQGKTWWMGRLGLFSHARSPLKPQLSLPLAE